MKEYISMPLSWRPEPEESEPWIERAIAYTSDLEPKKRRAKRKQPNKA